jgi:hypothetical protein
MKQFGTIATRRSARSAALARASESNRTELHAKSTLELASVLPDGRFKSAATALCGAVEVSFG